MTYHPTRGLHPFDPAGGHAGAAVVEGADGLLELIWPGDDVDTVPITRAALQAFVDVVNQFRTLARPPAPPAVDPAQLTIYDQLEDLDDDA